MRALALATLAVALLTASCRNCPACKVPEMRVSRAPHYVSR